MSHIWRTQSGREIVAGTGRESRAEEAIIAHGHVVEIRGVLPSIGGDGIERRVQEAQGVPDSLVGQRGNRGPLRCSLAGPTKEVKTVLATAGGIEAEIRQNARVHRGVVGYI